MRSKSRFISNSVLNIPVNSISAKKAVQGLTGALETPDYRNIPVFSAYEPLNIHGLKWIILAEIDYSEALVPVDRIRNDILLFSLVISIFILAIARLISNMITKPIIRLKNAALRAGQGIFNTRVDLRSTDEIGALAETFNNMIERITEERGLRLSAMYDGQEMERQRVSRELHDGLGQKLVGAKLQLENCEGKDYPCLQRTFRDLKTNIGSMIEETRQISSDLMPPALNELGLINALENLSRTTSHQSNIEVDFDSHGDFTPSDNKTTIYLYRIAQEAMSNAIRHAGASTIHMQVIENNENLILILEDNGKGFIPDRIEKGVGRGIDNMRERTRILGGHFTIESEPGKGTTIRVKIPKKS
jgi:two-component system NarL family sensor kinase